MSNVVPFDRSKPLSETSVLFKEHIDLLRSLQDAGDEIAAKSLACMVLLLDGWRFGDPDPIDPPDGDGGIPVHAKVA